MTNIQCAEDFANGLRHGKSNNMFIETCGNNTVVYSYGYHFPIAIKTSNCVYFTSDGYSRTTSKHKGLVRRAVEALGIGLELKTLQELKAML